jgi:hypothetical protein
MGMVVCVSAGVLESFFFFLSFWAAAGDIIDKKIARQTVMVKNARKLRAAAVTGPSAMLVLSLKLEGAPEE